MLTLKRENVTVEDFFMKAVVILSCIGFFAVLRVMQNLIPSKKIKHSIGKFIKMSIYILVISIGFAWFGFPDQEGEIGIEEYMEKMEAYKLENGHYPEEYFEVKEQMDKYRAKMPKE